MRMLIAAYATFVLLVPQLATSQAPPAVGATSTRTSSSHRPASTRQPARASRDDSSRSSALAFVNQCGMQGDGCEEAGTIKWQQSTTLESTMSLAIRDIGCTTGGYSVEFRVVAPNSVPYSITRDVRGDACDKFTEVKFPNDFFGQEGRTPSLVPGVYRWMGIVNHEIAVADTVLAVKHGYEILLESRR